MASAAHLDRRPQWASACHEAGHAVAAYAVGWGLKPQGVVIDATGGGTTFVQPDADRFSPWAYCFVALAGPASEPGAEVRSDARRLESVRAARRWLIDEECGGHAKDEMQAAGCLIVVTPAATDDDIATTLKAWEIETWAAVQAPSFRARVDGVAVALAERGRVAPDEFMTMMK